MSDTQLIKDKIDIAELVGEYVQLKTAGINKKACCPFHQEKTPSFMVNTERQIFKCFGCGKSGDIFTFVQEMEGMDFVESLKFLANKAGVQLSHRTSEINTSQKNRIKDINAQASRFFHNFLLKMDTSKLARDYLSNRGLSESTIEDWQIGYIPDQWELLTKYLLKKGYSIDDLVSSGLTIKREGADVSSGRGFYDRFRGRIMFPIQDVHGTVVGFTGRILVEKENTGGKYVNTPQTLVYDKSAVVFGLNKAKQDIKANNLIVMMEGQTDVIACHQAGMKNVVATSGTALTERQIKLLKRYSTNLNMAFDADEAGQNAALRGIDIAVAEGMEVRVIRIPENAGKDPDECIKKDKNVWFSAVKNASDIMDWYFDKAFAHRDISDIRQKQDVVDELIPKVSIIPQAVKRDHWLKKLAEAVDVDTSVIRDEIARLSKKKTKSIERVKIEKPIKEENTRIDQMIEQLLALVFKYPKVLSSSDANFECISKAISATKYEMLYKKIIELYNNNEQISPITFSSDEKYKKIVDFLLLQGEWFFSDLNDKQSENEFNKLLNNIKSDWNKEKRLELQKNIEQAEKSGDKGELKRLLEEFQNLDQ